MIVMCWDHSKDSIVSRAEGDCKDCSQHWQGPFSTFDGEWYYFLARFVSHFCAPGFFLLMGIGMSLFAVSRERRGWLPNRVRKHFMIRGLVLVFLARVVNVECMIASFASLIRGEEEPFAKELDVPVWILPFLGVFEVLTALGLALIIAGLLLPFFTTLRTVQFRHTSLPFSFNAGSGLAFILGVASFLLSAFTIVHYQGGDPTVDRPWPGFNTEARDFWTIAIRFLLIPGRIATGVVVYPAVPWVGLTFFGISVGFTFSSDPALAYRICAYASPILLLLFVIVRTVGGEYGNLRGWERGDKGAGYWIEFFNVCKYPPSAAYVLLTTGVNLAALTAFRQYELATEEGRLGYWCVSFIDKIRIFGQVPLFFYMVHWLLLGSIGFVVHLYCDGLFLPWLIPIWIVEIFILQYPCYLYGDFKNGTDPESLWRLL